MTSPDTSLDAQGTIPTPSASEAARERASGWRTIRRVLPYLWPEGQDWVKYRVVAALAMLVLAKLVAVSTPFFYKAAVDALGGDGTGWLLAVGAIGLTVAYGVARLMEIGFQELRNVLFTRVGQRALRQLALETFGHIHRLSLRYHISRKTGGLSRIIERGVKGVDFLLRFMLFSIFPLILQLLMIMAIFIWQFDWRYLLAVAVTIALYVWFTFKVTEWRVKQRREMNDQDTDANQKAIDSLLNFETVKYFNAEAMEARRYDAAMQKYEVAAVQTNYSLAFFEFRAGAADYERAGRCHGAGGHRRAIGRSDSGRFRDGQCVHDPDHFAAEFSGHGVSRDPSGVGGYGRYVRPAGPTHRCARQTRCAAPEGARRRGGAGQCALWL